MNKTWLRRMIWSYIPIFFIIFSFLFFMFFQTLVEQNNRNTRQSSRVFAGQLLQSLDVSLKSADHLILNEILNNRQLLDFFDETDSRDVFLNYQVIKRLTELRQEIPLIDSFYLVRYGDRSVFNGNVIKHMEEFEDDPFIRRAETSGANSPWSDVRAYREYAYQNKKEVVSIVHSVPLGQDTKGLFVVNISVDSLRDLILSMYDDKTAFVNVYDRSGHPLFTRDPAAGKKEVLTSQTSPYTGWRIEIGVPNGRIVGAISVLSGVWPILGILVFLGGVASIVYITRKNYKPLEDVVLRLNDKLFHDKPALGRVAADEFAFIESAIEHFAAYREKSFFSELLRSDPAAGADADRRIFPAHSGVKALIIEIDRPAFIRFSPRDRELFKFVLASVASEMIREHASIPVWLEWTSPLQLTAIAFMSETAPDLEAVCCQYAAWVDRNLAFTVTVGIGETANSPQGAAASYKEAQEALTFKAALGGNRVITFGETRTIGHGESGTHLRSVHKLAQQFRLRDGGWHESFEALFAGIRDSRLSKNEIARLIHYLIAHLDLQLSQMAKSDYESWTAHALPALKRRAEEFDTLEQLQAGFRSVLEDQAGRLAELREDRPYHRLMKDVRAYIEREYANPGLSLDFLSERFSVGAKYLSQLFKEETGENFLDFLASVRIRHAKERLLAEPVSIQQIGESVGYVNAATFRRVFRKVTGESPVDFRKRHEIGETG
ncbi:helix-turn-helix domain-containing protein [Paenibacillus humicola]|uniref:helix-turn-helix domain-containing protein n=1 Tax=Paenibacillus humicola TaxID=3110540 RepID=UPI00237A2BED|nr:helix-turn-helix domain-containing protein [Paenibacillus humicola]